MGYDISVQMKFAVKTDPKTHDEGERLFKFLSELAAGGIGKLSPMRIDEGAKGEWLICVTDSYLRSKTGYSRYLSKPDFPKTHLPDLCRKYNLQAEVWTSCGEVGYDEHFVVDCDGSILLYKSLEYDGYAFGLPEGPDFDPEAERQKRNGAGFLNSPAKHGAISRFLAMGGPRMSKTTTGLNSTGTTGPNLCGFNRSSRSIATGRN